MSESDNRLYNAELLEMLQKTESLEEFWQLVDTSDVEQFALDVLGFFKSSLVGPLDERIAFMRIPKCATTSVHRSLARMYRSVYTFDGNGLHSVHHGACDGAADAQDMTTWEMRRNALAYLLAHEDAKFVAGHFEVNANLLEKFGQKFNFITLLRDPVERWISHYLYNVYLPRERYDIDQEMGEFVETSRGRGIAQMYTAYLSGTGSMSCEERGSGEVLEEAKKNLGAFELVGIVEEMGTFQEQFADRFGQELKVRRRNTSPAPEGAKEISPSVRDKIREACSADLEIYEYARQNVA